MNRTRDLLDLSAVYEAAKVNDPKAKFGTKPGKPMKAIPTVKIKEPLKDDGQPTQPFAHKDSGPANADGFNAKIVDPKTNKGKENHFEPEKFSDIVKKSVKEDINTFMSNKSIFDKLYEEVMGGPEDAEALDAQELGVAPSDEGDKSEADMTPKELIAKALELLQLAHDKCPAEEVGGESEGSSEEGGSEEGAPEEQEESKKKGEEDNEDAEVAGEAVDAEEIGHPVVDSEKLSKGLNKVSSGSNVVPSEVSSAGKKAGKGGDGKVTDKVGNDGDKGHALVGGGVSGGAPTPVKGKSNVVNSRIKGNNQSFFNV
jgi:hypothetical protein